MIFLPDEPFVREILAQLESEVPIEHGRPILQMHSDGTCENVNNF